MLLLQLLMEGFFMVMLGTCGVRAGSPLGVDDGPSDINRGFNSHILSRFRLNMIGNALVLNLRIEPHYHVSPRRSSVGAPSHHENVNDFETLWQEKNLTLKFSGSYHGLLMRALRKNP